MCIKIIGTGSSLPVKSVHNDDLAAIVDTSDEWISSRTGIKSRHICETETCVSLAADAALSAIDSAHVSPDDIGLIITATMSPDNVLPNTACSVANIIGATKAVCFDISAACSGFIYALTTAYAYINSGICSTALIIGAEVLSKYLDFTDRSTCVLFGDGAGACIVKKCEDSSFYSKLYSDGSLSDVLTCAARPINNMLVKNEQALDYISMNGREVFKFAVTEVPKSINAILEEAALTKDDISHYILHQANTRIIESISKRLGVPIDRFPTNLATHGNTSAASIPILLDELYKASIVHPGDRILLSGFGGGLTWGVCIISIE